MGLFNNGFFAGLAFVSTLTGVNSLICISMNNQECKVRPQIVNVNGNDPVFFPFNVKINKCSGSCNNINNPLAKLCSWYCKKTYNAKMFNVVSGTNQTRRIEWHEMCKCKLDLNIVFVIINSIGMMINAGVNAKNWLIKVSKYLRVLML